MKVIGIIPARMAASRFPGKPLHSIHGKAMLEHVFLRAKLYDGWDRLVIATCDQEIEQFSKKNGFPVVMTGSHHTRAHDRVAEAFDFSDELHELIANDRKTTRNIMRKEFLKIL